MATQYATQIKAKVFQVREATGPCVRDGSDFLAPFDDIRNACKEMFFVVTLNQKNKVIDRHLISMGTLTASLVHPREVFRPAILDNAAAVAFVHNHPSGDTTPSSEDRSMTRRLKDCAELLGIRLLDHIIIGGDNYTSFLDEGLL